MSEARTFVTFESDLSPVTSSAPEEPAGRAIAEVLAVMLAAQGLQVDGPYPYGEYGWEIAAWQDAGRFLFVFQRSDAWLLIAEERTGLFARLMKKPRPSFQRLLAELAASLERDARFRSVQWFTRDEFHASAAP